MCVHHRSIVLPFLAVMLWFPSRRLYMGNLVEQHNLMTKRPHLCPRSRRHPSLSRRFVASSEPVKVLRFASSLIMLFPTSDLIQCPHFATHEPQWFWGHWRSPISQLQHLPLQRLISNFSMIQNPPSSLITHSDSAGQRLALELPCLFIFNLIIPWKTPTNESPLTKSKFGKRFRNLTNFNSIFTCVMKSSFCITLYITPSNKQSKSSWSLSGRPNDFMN